MITTLVLLSVIHVSKENDYDSTISSQKIKYWWERKITNYLQNYARRNKMAIAPAKEKIFSKTHEKFFESIPHALKNILDEKYGR